MPDQKPLISLIVLTYNEEVNIEQCLRSVAGLAQDVYVVDSGSTDQTVEIARRLGAQVVTNPFQNQAQQFNWALDNLPIETDWVIRLDADEYLSPELRAELRHVLAKLPRTVNGLYMKRRVIFLNRWIRFGGYYPSWFLRVFRAGKARSEQLEMDEHLVLLEGQSGRLKRDFIHDDHKPLSAWTLKHEAYATREARISIAQQAPEVAGVQATLLGNQVERKRWLKGNFYSRSPLFLRAFVYFLYRYFIRRGFLDGVEGLVFHFLQAFWYRFYVDAKIYESRKG